MPEHVHQLESEPQRAILSTAMQALKLGFVREDQRYRCPSSDRRATCSVTDAPRDFSHQRLGVRQTWVTRSQTVLPSPSLQHLAFIHPRDSQAFHRTLQVFADFK